MSKIDNKRHKKITIDRIKLKKIMKFRKTNVQKISKRPNFFWSAQTIYIAMDTEKMSLELVKDIANVLGVRASYFSSFDGLAMNKEFRETLAICFGEVELFALQLLFTDTLENTNNYKNWEIEEAQELLANKIIALSVTTN